MGMHKLDFLSSSPHSFIFHQNSNKTNFGGVLSLIYLIVVLIITAFYLVFYLIADNYTVEYLYHEKILTQEENQMMKNNPRYNPIFKFDIGLYDGSFSKRKRVEDRFIIKDVSLGNLSNATVDTFGSYHKKVTEVDWYILYDCLNETRENCKIDRNQTESDFVTFLIQFQGYELDHQNKDSPFHPITGEKYYHYKPTFSLSNPVQRGNIWSLVKYKEDKGFLSIFDKFNEKDEDDNKIIGPVVKSFEETEFSKLYETKNLFVHDIRGDGSLHFYKLIGEVYFSIDFYHYEEYKRTPKSFWDAIANICSLSMTVLSGFSYIFLNYYSNNFDNYKIIENILYNTKPKQEKKENKEEIELSNDFNKTDNLLDKNNEDKNIIITKEESQKIDVEDNKELINENKDMNNKEDYDRLPKLRFVDFFFNNIYSSKLCKINRQKIIHKCNEIISKYYSIENLLYNQIKLENLFKDYKWNNPSLNKFDNNELIIQLKNLISSFQET